MADTGSTNDNKTDISALQSKPDKFSQFFNAWNDRNGHTGLVLNKNLQASCWWSTKSHKLTRNHPIQVSIFYLPGIQLIDCPFAQGLTGVSISLKYYWWCFKRTLILALGKVLQCKLLRPSCGNQHYQNCRSWTGGPVTFTLRKNMMCVLSKYTVITCSKYSYSSRRKLLKSIQSSFWALDIAWPHKKQQHNLYKDSGIVGQYNNVTTAPTHVSNSGSGPSSSSTGTHSINPSFGLKSVTFE